MSLLSSAERQKRVLRLQLFSHPNYESAPFRLMAYKNFCFQLLTSALSATEGMTIAQVFGYSSEHIRLSRGPTEVILC